MAAAKPGGSAKKKTTQKSGEAAPPPVRTAGPVTMRMQSISPEARDNVPRTDDSAGALLIGMLLVLLAVGGVAWHYLKRFLTSTPAPTAQPQPILPTNPTTLEELTLRPEPVTTLWTHDASGQYLIPVHLPHSTTDPLTDLRQHLNDPIPPEGTTRVLPGASLIRDLRREGDLALVDLAPGALEGNGGEAGTQSLLEALTRSVTGIEGITRVQFLVDGKADAMTPNGVSLADPWTVADLNPPNTLATTAGSASGTFYFFDTSRRWLVPVTLAYDPGSTPLESALRRLWEGPPAGSGLAPSVPRQVTLDEVAFNALTGRLELRLSSIDPPQSWGLYAPAKMLEAVVLTASQVVAVKKLAVTINDQDIWSVEPFADARTAVSEIQSFNPEE
ncbi:MAG: GerMN domain-containing protein [bacterium]